VAGGGVHGRHVEGGPGVAAVDVNRGVLPDPALGPAGSPDVQADHLPQIARPAHLEPLLRERGTYSGLVREFVSAPLRSQTVWLHILPTETGFNSVVFGRGIQSALALGLAVAITSGGLVRCDVGAGAYGAQRRPRH